MTDVPMSFMDHVTELRLRLIKSVMAVTVATIVGFIFNRWILDVLSSPYKDAIGEELVFFRPTEAFSLVMRISLFGGVIIASPVIIYQLWRFVSPALTAREKKYVVPMSIILAILFMAGVALGYWSLSRGLVFLIGFGGEDLQPVIGGEFYLSFAMRFILAFGIAFEFPVFLFGAAAVGVIDSRRLRSSRRYALVILLVLAALITPSGDPLTLTLLTVPLYLLYEITILAIRYFLKK